MSYTNRHMCIISILSYSGYMDTEAPSLDTDVAFLPLAIFHGLKIRHHLTGCGLGLSRATLIYKNFSPTNPLTVMKFGGVTKTARRSIRPLKFVEGNAGCKTLVSSSWTASPAKKSAVCLAGG